MILALENLLPVFLVILTGVGLARARVVTAPMWEGIDRVNYYLLFPALIVVTLASADLAGAPVLGMVATMLAALATMAALALALRLPLARAGVGGPAFTSVFQGAVRWHTFIALAVIGALHGGEGLGLAAIAVATMIPVINVACVAVLSAWGGDGRAGIGAVARGIATNPLIIACLVGVAIAASGVELWRPVIGTLDILGRAALGLALLSVGGGLDVARAARPDLAVGVSAALKLALMPVLMAGYATLFGVTGLGFTIVVLCGAVPTASASYVLARQMGGDAELMARIVATHVLVAMVTLPVVLALIG